MVSKAQRFYNYLYHKSTYPVYHATTGYDHVGRNLLDIDDEEFEEVIEKILADDDEDTEVTNNIIKQ